MTAENWSKEKRSKLFEAMLDIYGEAFKLCRSCDEPTHISHKCRWCGAQNP